MLGLVALTAVAVAPAGAGRTVAYADEACTARLVDEPARLGQYAQSVEQLATTLTTTLGADVYVRVLGRIPNADIDRWQADTEARCANWRDPSGRRATKLLVLAVAVDDRRTGLYYGDTWKPALDTEWKTIQTEQMNPLFQKGEIGAGIVTGLSSVTSLIAPLAAGGDAVVPTTVYRDQPRRVPLPEPDAGFEEFPGSDGGGGDGIPGALFGVFAVIGLIGVGAKIFSVGGSGLGGPDADGNHGMHGWRSRRRGGWGWSSESSGPTGSFGSFGSSRSDDSPSHSGRSGAGSTGGTSTGGGGGSTSW